MTRRFGVVDRVDDAEVADAEPPPVAVDEGRRAGRPGLDREGQDGSAKPGGVAGRQLAELARRGGGEVDAVGLAALRPAAAHRSDPYSAFVSAASFSK